MVANFQMSEFHGEGTAREEQSNFDLVLGNSGRMVGYLPPGRLVPHAEVCKRKKRKGGGGRGRFQP